jgi:uncharacterized protein (TIGR00369 family)
MFFIGTTMAALRRKKLDRLPILGEAYRQGFNGDPLHVCYGCSHSNESGLKLNFQRADIGGLGFAWQPRAGLESFPNIVHGGVTSTLLDEVCGVTVQAELGRVGLTVSSRIHFHRPVYQDQLVRGHAKVVAKYQRYVLVRGTIFDQEGRILASMTALFFIPNMKIFKKVTNLKDEDISEAIAKYVD